MDPASPWGMLPHAAADESVIATLHEGGVAWLRLGSNWYLDEPQPGVYRWDALDAAVRFARKRGMHVLLGIAYSAPWALQQADRAQPRN